MLLNHGVEKTLVIPLDCKEIQPVSPRVNQSWIFIGKTDTEAETLIFWPPDAKYWLIWKEPDAEKDWKQEEKRMTEDKMVGWHHWLDGHDFESAPGAGDGQGGQVYRSPCAHEVSDMTEQLSWTELNWCLPLLHCHIPFCSVEDGQESEKTSHRMRENICKWYIQ